MYNTKHYRDKTKKVKKKDNFSTMARNAKKQIIFELLPTNDPKLLAWDYLLDQSN